MLLGSDILRYMRRFDIIAVHLRFGDYKMIKEPLSEGLSASAQGVLDSTLDCVSRISSAIQTNQLADTPTMVYLASDSIHARQYALTRIPQMLLMLGIEPKHTAKQDTTSLGALNALMEMILLATGTHFIFEQFGEWGKAESADLSACEHQVL